MALKDTIDSDYLISYNLKIKCLNILLFVLTLNKNSSKQNH